MSESHAERIEWMHRWAVANDAQLILEGECGFGRECVGVLVDGSYPDYEWYDERTYNRADENGKVWIPEDAYHKHPCVAVLGRGEAAETQLYEWLKWFDANGFHIERGAAIPNPALGAIVILLGHDRYCRMVRK